MKHRGVVKWFADDKGYGFIAQRGRPDTFVHFTSIDTATATGRRKLTEGQIVEFYIEEDKQSGKPHAVGVTIVSEVEA